MKTLKFEPELVTLILNGSKTITWRLFDDKNLKTGDLVTFIKRPKLTPFAHAQLTQVETKRLKDLSAEDRIGHEDVGTEENMYKMYSAFYKTTVTSDTELKVIKFKILSTF